MLHSNWRGKFNFFFADNKIKSFIHKVPWPHGWVVVTKCHFCFFSFKSKMHLNINRNWKTERFSQWQILKCVLISYKSLAGNISSENQVLQDCIINIKNIVLFCFFHISPVFAAHNSLSFSFQLCGPLGERRLLGRPEELSLTPGVAVWCHKGLISTLPVFIHNLWNVIKKKQKKKQVKGQIAPTAQRRRVLLRKHSWRELSHNMGLVDE